MSKLSLEKEEKLEIKLPNIPWIVEKASQEGQLWSDKAMGLLSLKYPQGRLG